jgi:hypothetical protein
MILAVASAHTARAELARGRQWRKIEVPGAVCGDGKPYPIFVSAGDPERIAFDVMGGGACWDAVTCYALPDTWVHPIPAPIDPGGFVSADPARSPVAGYTMVYFPYCTGDVHLGSHVARYLPGVDFHHAGATNFRAALSALKEDGAVDLEHARQFVMMGYSAGALGALSHVFDVEPLVRQVPDKVLIADSPGLHFGNTFWDKFTPALIHDFTVAMGRVGLRITPGEGNLSSLVPLVCHQLPDWRVGVLQGSRDVVMSSVFGAISPDDHERMVYGSNGVFELTRDPMDNCSAWVPRTEMHTFLVTDQTAAIRASTGDSAVDYIRNLVLGVWGRGRAVAGPNFKFQIS